MSRLKVIVPNTGDFWKWTDLQRESPFRASFDMPELRLHPERHEPYRPIEDYALIGNGITAALVSRDGSIDWACFPRFDSPSVFARLLDSELGGYWQVVPTTEFAVERRYDGESNILVTTFRTDEGVAKIVDFLPVDLDRNPRTGAIVRMVHGLEGEVELEVRFYPRFDYGRHSGTWSHEKGKGVRAINADVSLTLYTAAPFTLDGKGAVGKLRVLAGREHYLLLEMRQQASLLWRSEPAKNVRRMYDLTREHWSRWIAQCEYKGPHADMVRRSALVLKAMDYALSGAMIAAPTTSLPEKLGGVRNWDYRYTWLRDTALSLRAFFNLGFRREGEEFFEWVLNVAAGDPAGLQVLYGVEGETRIDEFLLDHLEGYRGAIPVRVGNAAYNQKQHDIYGEILDCAFLLHKHGGVISKDLWRFLARVVDHVGAIWEQPDSGIWEIRSEPRHFVHSKAMCWVAVDRGIQLSRTLSFPADLEKWERLRQEIMQELVEQGYKEHRGAFTQSYETDALDASVLQLLLRNVLPVDDLRMRSTVEAIARELTVSGMLQRYPMHAPDGLPPGEGVFLMCTFWLLDCWAEMGELEKAHQLFEHLLGYANDVGLYAEELDPRTGAHLGNFPQAFSHLSLINAAITLDKAESALSAKGTKTTRGR
ncbi:MAG: glycoside hydrolase family 15 protein [Candidatus Korobacteraceae bacterium]